MRDDTAAVASSIYTPAPPAWGLESTGLFRADSCAIGRRRWHMNIHVAGALSERLRRMPDCSPTSRSTSAKFRRRWNFVSVSWIRDQQTNHAQAVSSVVAAAAKTNFLIRKLRGSLTAYHAQVFFSPEPVLKRQWINYNTWKLNLTKLRELWHSTSNNFVAYSNSYVTGLIIILV